MKRTWGTAAPAPRMRGAWRHTHASPVVSIARWSKRITQLSRVLGGRKQCYPIFPRWTAPGASAGEANSRTRFAWKNGKDYVQATPGGLRAVRAGALAGFVGQFLQRGFRVTEDEQLL